MLKYCHQCKTDKLLDEFNANKSRKDGLQTYCKICSRVRQKADYKTNPNRRKSVAETRDKNYSYNRRFINKYKRWCKCKCCGENTSICLDFHHIDPSEKDIEVSILVGMSFTRLVNEIRKCVVLCSNCHRKVHAGILRV